MKKNEKTEKVLPTNRQKNPVLKESKKKSLNAITLWDFFAILWKKS